MGNLEISSNKRLGALGAVVLTAALLLAPSAAAKFPPAEPAEPPAGITITGIGFTRVAGTQGRAIELALADARRRARTVAHVAGIEVGAAEHVEMREISQFGSSAGCRHGRVRRGGRGQSGPCPRLRAAAATVTFAIVGGGDGSAATRTLSAGGGAAIRVAPANPDRNRSIRRAMRAARRAATPEAATVAFRNARAAARAADFALGPLVSIAEAPASYYMPTFYEPALGTFGPGQFCGIIRRPVFRPDPQTGRTEVVRRVPQRRCTFVRPYAVQLEIRYEAR